MSTSQKPTFVDNLTKIAKNAVTAVVDVAENVVEGVVDATSGVVDAVKTSESAANLGIESVANDVKNATSAIADATANTIGTMAANLPAATVTVPAGNGSVGGFIDDATATEVDLMNAVPETIGQSGGNMDENSEHWEMKYYKYKSLYLSTK